MSVGPPKALLFRRVPTSMIKKNIGKTFAFNWVFFLKIKVFYIIKKLL